jgi:hypothetical protein
MCCNRSSGGYSKEALCAWRKDNEKTRVRHRKAEERWSGKIASGEEFS